MLRLKTSRFHEEETDKERSEQEGNRDCQGQRSPPHTGARRTHLNKAVREVRGEHVAMWGRVQTPCSGSSRHSREACEAGTG